MVQRQVEEDEEETLQTKLSSTAQPLIQRQTEDAEEEPLQTKSPGTTGTRTTEGIQMSLHSLKGGGQPLSSSTRAFFEPRFGVDFSHVRVHTDSTAARLSRQLNAEAFTYGRDIFFNSGRYNPSTTTGKRLLAHELTHVVQQGGIAENKKLRCSTYNFKNTIQRWSSSEHVYIGEQAYNSNAMEGIFKGILQAHYNRRVSLKHFRKGITFGEAVAMADFYP
ncbi:MAG: DUF4157 domain-containing protein, partial [Nitrospirae bacterium]|nr:DUF4157 domain-containing protein [Nitrospirota bacterium]